MNFSTMGLKSPRLKCHLSRKLKDFSTPDFSTMNVSTPWFKKCGFERFMVEKSGVERGGVEMSFNRPKNRLLSLHLIINQNLLTYFVTQSLIFSAK